MPETINGLPLHPLVVHATVVLIPLVFVVSIIMVLRQAWRRSLGWWAVLLALAATAAAVASTETGEALAAVVGEPLRHASLGEGLPYFAAALLVVLTAYVVAGAFADWRRGRKPTRNPLVQGAMPAESVLPATQPVAIEDPAVATTAATVPPAPPTSLPVPPRKVPLVVTILGLLTVLVGALTTVQTFRVGESGAQAVWGAELAAAQASPAPSAASRVIPMSEVTRHGSGDDCWTVINGTVYDLTAWVAEHPGGTGPIVSLCGTDGTTSFTSQHAGEPRPETELAGFEIGTIK